MQNNVGHFFVIGASLALGFLCTNANGALIFLEGNLSSVIGALVGGVIAAVTLYLAVISNRLERKSAVLSIQDKQNLSSANRNLKYDLFILVGSLVLVVLLPFLRTTFVSSDPRFILPTFLHTLLFGTLNSAAFLYAIAATVECINVMFESIEAIYLQK